jgi:hypothetical protein
VEKEWDQQGTAGHLVVSGVESGKIPLPWRSSCPSPAPFPAQVTIVRSEVKNKLFIGNLPRTLTRDKILEVINKEVVGE